MAKFDQHAESCALCRFPPKPCDCGFFERQQKLPDLLPWQRQAMEAMAEHLAGNGGRELSGQRRKEAE